MVFLFMCIRIFLIFPIIAKSFTDSTLKSGIDFAPQLIFDNTWTHYWLSQVAKDCHLH